MEAKNNGLDLVWGAAAIGLELNITQAKAFHLLEAGHIPARKVGGRWVAHRAKLRALFDDSPEAA